MTTAKIGPISLGQSHEIVDPESEEGQFNLSIKCTPEEAKQLKGLCQPSTRSDTTSPRIIYSKDNRWGLLPIKSPDGEVIPSFNEYTGLLEGFCILSNPQEYYINPRRTKFVALGEMVSETTDEILTLLYTRGGEDGTDIEHNYDDLTPAYIINESGADFDTTNDWFTASKYRMANGAIASSGGQIVFSGGADADGVPGQVWTNHRTQFDHGFIMEFTLYPGNKPSAGNKDKDINVWFSPNRSSSTPPVWNDSYLISLGVSSTNQYYQIHTIGSPGGGSWWCLKPITVDNTPTAFKFRLTTDNKYYMKVELSRYVSGAWTAFSEVFYGPTNLGAWSDFYMGVYYLNRDSTSNSMSMSDIKVYNYLESDKPNVVVLPPDAIPNKTPDFYRASEEGNIQCFKNLSESLNFQIDPLNYYKGGVKGWNSNYTDSVPRLVTYNEVDLSIGKFNFTNGIIKLVPTSNGVEMYCWNGTSYILVNTFTFSHLTQLIRPFYVSKDVFTLQLDRTFWTLRAGKPFVYVEHPYDDLGYTLKPSHYHDGILDNFTSSGDVSMLTQFYDLCFTTYNMLTTNQYSAETDLTGFVAQGSTITRIADGYDGAYCINIVTNNAASGEGVQLYPHSALPITPAVGLPVYAYAWVKGSGSVVIQLIERDSGGAVVATKSSSVHTLTGSYVKLSVLSLISSTATAYISMKILTPTRQLATINSDAHGLGPTMDSSISGSTYPPISSARYGMIITQKNPTTIKSDTIPACEITGIGVYDQMQPPSSDNYYLSLAREFYRPTQQGIALQGV